MRGLLVIKMFALKYNIILKIEKNTYVLKRLVFYTSCLMKQISVCLCRRDVGVYVEMETRRALSPSDI